MISFCLHQWGRYYDSQYICAREAGHEGQHNGYLLGSWGGVKLMQLKSDSEWLMERLGRQEPVGLEVLQGT